VITARRFIERAKLEPLVAALEPQAHDIVYLEDIRAKSARCSAWPPWCAPRSAARLTGRSAPTPGGRALPLRNPKARRRASCSSHRNLLGNRHQLASVSI